MPRYDVVVIGGGLVGLSLACELARLGLNFAVVDKAPLASPQGVASKDYRATGLSYTSVKLLERLEVWSEIAAQAQPIKSVYVSERGRFGTAALHAAELNLPALGYSIANGELRAALRRRLASVKFTAIAGSVIGVMTTETAASVVIDSHREPLQATVVVLADGGQSSLPQQLGFEFEQRDYQRSALVATAVMERCHAGCAYQRFTPQGPVAALPMQDRLAALVMVLPPERIEAVAGTTSAGFCAEFERRFGRRLGKIASLQTPVGQYPLRLRAVREQFRGRVILAGNAARTLHPVAAQGFNLALRDVVSLADLLSKRLLGEHVDQPALTALGEAFAASRRADQRWVQRATDGLARGFSLQGPVSHLRGLALCMIDAVPALRQEIARRGMGLHSI